MSAPYFCTRCQRQHVRGAIYNEHQQFKDTDLQKSLDDIQAGRVQSLDDYKLQREINKAAIPGECQPTTIINGNVEKWEAHRETQKNTPVIDRTTEAMIEKFPAAKAPKKPSRWQLWKESWKLNHKH